MKNIKAILIYAWILTMIFLVACGGTEKRNVEGFEEEAQNLFPVKSQAPEELDNLEDLINELIKKLGGPIEFPNFHNSFSHEMEKNNSSQAGEKALNQEINSEGENQEPNNQELDEWDMILNNLNDLHAEWNRYIPFASEANAQITLIEAFGNNLSDLTQKVSERDRYASLMVGNNLYDTLIDFFHLYEKEDLNATKKIRTIIRKILIKVEFQQWESISIDLEDLRATFNLLVTKLNQVQYQEKKQVTISLAYTIEEFLKSIERQNIILLKMKGSIILKNLQDIESS